MRIKLALPILLLIAVLAFALSPTVEQIGGLGIRETLPERVGARQGTDALFCQNEQCARAFDVDAGASLAACPVCGGELDPMSPGERRALPGDTTLLKKKYAAPGGPPYYVSVVISGFNHRSVHRPQQCLPAQGNTIEAQRVIAVPRAHGDPLPVMLLRVRREMRALDGSMLERGNIFAYWFVAEHAETPHHLERLWRMTLDRAIRGEHRRWAYVAVLTDADRNNWEAAETRMADFIAELYPHLSP